MTAFDLLTNYGKDLHAVEFLNWQKILKDLRKEAQHEEEYF